MDYAEQQEWKRKQEYKKYYHHRRSVGCRPLTYGEWLDWRARERQQRMK